MSSPSRTYGPGRSSIFITSTTTTTNTNTNVVSSQPLEITLDLIHLHNITPPSTPPPPPTVMLPLPLRYPETVGTIVSIHSSESKGLGVFALHDIPPRTILLCEAPLITLIDTGTRADPLDAAVAALTQEKQDSFHSLHAFSRSKHESLNRSIVYSNGYSIMNDLATGVFETASRINHSCVPNSHYVWKESLGRMVFYNRFKLLAGEEVTVDYGHNRKYLKRIYGFECACGGCTDGSDGVSEGMSVSSSESGRGTPGPEEMARIDALISEGMGGDMEDVK